MKATHSHHAPRAHLIHVYSDVDNLAEHVASFLAEGVRQGEPAVVIATPEHAARFGAILARQGVDPAALIGEGRLVTLDAAETLGRLMVDGQPDAGLFAAVVGGVFGQVRDRWGSGPVRAYGEMVDLLCQAGQHSAAGRLEALWNDFLAREEFRLLCAYDMDLLTTPTAQGHAEALICAHTHVLPAATRVRLDAAVASAMNEVLGQGAAQKLRPLLERTRYPPPLQPGGLATLLWLRRHLPDRSDQILAHTRRHYGAALPTLQA